MYAMLATIDQTHLPTPHKASEKLNIEFRKLALPINEPEMLKTPLYEDEEEEDKKLALPINEAEMHKTPLYEESEEEDKKLALPINEAEMLKTPLHEESKEEDKKLALPINEAEMLKTPLHEEEEEDSDEDDENQCKNVIEYPKDDLVEFSVDPRDVGTSDSWIKRNPNLIRLTGRHPYNSETPVDLLMSHGFLTPTSLHYVRNHGYVPRAESLEQWTVEVSGLVEKPRTFTMSEIMSDFTPAEIPVTLVCAGNRRKEQNMVRQTIGFNWGPGGIGTSMWRGARLAHILRRCGIHTRKNKKNSKSSSSSSSSSRVATHVCLEGREMLPGGGSETPYATSISLDLALDESCDVLVAYMQNGKLLEPDHGFPARMIIPGHIGGRMVKWLTRITVTGKESENYYHYRDNRVLPSHVDAEKANAEGWWYKPEYIINELNINSVITTPSHDQIVPIDANTLQVPFRLEGYAYSGGGRKVTRVEVTLDGGETWMLSEITHPERPTEHGRYWCWCFWRLDVDLIQLIQAKELAVRAWDSSMNTQPQTLTWNVMGMMNNCWFRVKINPCKATGHGGIGLAFEHPTQPGNQGGGWMIPPNKVSSSNDQQHTPSKVLGKSLSSPGLNPGGFEHRHITDAELKRHNTRESAWISVHNNVYDCTKFLKEHPGGSDSILINAGTDCTEEFDAIHSTKAKAMLEDFKIGEMVSIGGDSSIVMNGVNMPIVTKHIYPLSPISESRPIALNPTQKIKVRLASKITLSHDVRLLRFELPSKEHILGLPVGKHIFLSAMIDGKLCLRAYTPVSSNEDVGYFELLVKVYFKGVHPKFPDGGLMSQYLDSLHVGGSVEVKGPLGHIEYIGNGHYTQEGQRYHMKKCAMMAGGTGITPIYQLVRAILNDPSDTTEIYLVFANRTESDIMLRNELEDWAREHPNFKLWYVVERANDNGTWPYSLGFMNENILEEHLPKASPETSAFMCGPPPMIKFACLPNLEKMGYDKVRCHQF